MNNLHRTLLLAFASFALATALPARADTLLAGWNDVTLRAIRNSTLGPPMVARALAIVHTATYDAWAAYDEVAVGTRLGGTLRRPVEERTLANKEKAISYAAYRALIDLFPTQTNLFNGTMYALSFDPADTSVDTTTPQGIGNVTAQAILDFRHQDGSNQLGDEEDANSVVVTTPYGDYTGYQPVNTTNMIIDPNRWQPLVFSNGLSPKFIAPHWSNVVAFALTNPAQFRPSAPARTNQSRYRTQAKEIIALTSVIKDRQKVIAEYWADGPRSELPPGHWLLFTQYISERDGHGIDQDAKMFFAVANAVLDAGISTWEVKRFYDSVRPITAVHYLYSGKLLKDWRRDTNNNNRLITVNGEDWLPYQPGNFITPPFGEYSSGHSAFSAAAAEVLKSFTGSDLLRAQVTIYPGTSKVEPGVTPKKPTVLAWRTFSQAADEAGVSRRYGGIHFKQGDVEARKLGRKVGKAVWKKAKTYFDGTAPAPTL